MDKVKAKKHLGQHFLKEESVAQQIAESLVVNDTFNKVLEVGPGTGVLTKYLLEKFGENFSAMEIDDRAVDFLQKKYPMGKIFR